MDLIKRDDIVLVLWDTSLDLESSKPNIENVSINFENIHRISLALYEDSTFTLIILKNSTIDLDIQLFAKLCKLLKPSGRIAITAEYSGSLESLKLAGFINVATINNYYVAEKPSYEIGSSSKLSFSSKKVDDRVAAIWKLSDDDDGGIINENDLLDESDKVKPNPTDLKVCGTTGKRKACKDCSCGLAEELSAENQKVQSSETAKSSCGSCYLGDAFRCASCPYLGLPAFKPGEKVQLSGGLLKDDI